jgi:hypothetical protein
VIHADGWAPAPARTIRTLARSIAVMALVPAALLLAPAPAMAQISTPDALGIAKALVVEGTPITGASWVAQPPTTNGVASGISNLTIGDFFTTGPTFAIMTTGDVHSADLPNEFPSTTTRLGGASVHGGSDLDVSILKIDLSVAANQNCLRFDFKFFTEEYPDFAGTQYNDAFIAELDSTTWKAPDTTDAVDAPNNFAFGTNHQPITLNSQFGGPMPAAPTTTTYDGATPTLTAATPITAGAHSVYLSIFDRKDDAVDSAVFLDNLFLGSAANPSTQCKAGAQPKLNKITVQPASATKEVGGTHSVTATAFGSNGEVVKDAAIGFEVGGANVAKGASTTDANGQATFTFAGTHAGNDLVVAYYDANNNGVRDVMEVDGSASVSWTAAPAATTPVGFPGLPVTGGPVGLIAGVGAGAIVLGVAGYILIRRRRVRFVAE